MFDPKPVALAERFTPRHPAFGQPSPPLVGRGGDRERGRGGVPRKGGRSQRVAAGDRLVLTAADGTEVIVNVDAVGKRPTLRVVAPAEVRISHEQAAEIQQS